MRILILVTGLLISSMGGLALGILPKPESFSFFQGALTLGGSMLICFAFSFRMKWHGIMGSAILGMLGFARGLGNIPHLFEPHASTAKPWMELLITILCLILLATSLAALGRERKRRILENMQPDQNR